MTTLKEIIIFMLYVSRNTFIYLKLREGVKNTDADIFANREWKEVPMFSNMSTKSRCLYSLHLPFNAGSKHPGSYMVAFFLPEIN